MELKIIVLIFVFVTNLIIHLSKHFNKAMEYNQETINRIRDLMPLCMRKKVHSNINKGVSEKAHIPYSTVCDVLQTYRDGGRPRYKNRRLKVYDECVRLLNEKGITV